MQFDTFTLTLLFSSIVYLSLALFVFWFFRGHPGANSFVGLMMAIFIYSTGYYFELHSGTLAQIYFWLKIEYVGITTFPVLFLLFTMQYTRRDRSLNYKLVAALFVMPLIIYVMMYTNDSHHLFYGAISMSEVGGVDLLHIVPGPWYWVNVLYINLMVLIANAILVQMWLKTPRLLTANMPLCSSAPWFPG